MANIRKSIGSSSFVEVIDRILDKGIVIDAWAKAMVPIELISIEARVVIASVSDAEQLSHEEFASQERRLRDRLDALSAAGPGVEVDQ